jgi:5-methylcytosine-specific restriction endonuclease McrA
MDAALPRKQELGRSEWAIARKRAIASNEPYCAICNHYIDVTLPMIDPETGKRNPLAVEVDHIVPRSRGGALYELENLLLTHSRCNRKRGSKMAEDYEGLAVDNPVPLSNNW